MLTFGFLALVARAMPSDEYAGFGAFWSMTLILGFGAFLPVELELARSLSDRGSTKPPPGTGRTTGLLAVGGVASTLIAAPLLVTAFGGQTGPLVALVALVLTSAGQFVLRGMLLGRGRLRTHGTLLLVDSVLRVAFAGLVSILLPGAGPTAYAWALVAAIATTHVPLLVWQRTRASGPHGEDVGPLTVQGPSHGFGYAVAHLLIGTLAAQVLLNSAPIVVAALADRAEAAAAAAFVACFTLVRLPLFVAVSLQSALVPLLVGARRSGGPAAARALVVRILLGTGGISLVALAVGAALGPPTVGLLFGPEFTITGLDFGLLSAGAAIHLGLLVVSQVLVADQRHRAVAVVWASGLAAGALVLAAVPDLLLRATLAFTVGSAIALSVSAFAVLSGAGAVPLREEDTAAPSVTPRPPSGA
ncbi:lipopolysaccharide biosynthesis protein [Modestobacter sp. Leaf380]|uniref:lipopolysaccharide biosynthesis protein n=1 Tax=Modestobacter sp. Leaf380 TaxID=1736356 RepID=UPI0012FB9064|nr:hypothetical protein [Modestobacter sp. Leaf380]